MQTGDRDDANSVQEFADCVGENHSFLLLLAISYMVITVATRTNKHYLDTLTILKRPVAAGSLYYIRSLSFWVRFSVTLVWFCDSILASHSVSWEEQLQGRRWQTELISI